MINVVEQFKLLYEKATREDNTDVYHLEPIRFQKPFILLGLDLLNRQRRIYIDITEERWDEQQLKAFPKWRGVLIQQEAFAQLGPLKNKTFLVISQSEENGEDIFEQLVQNLVDHILYNSETPLYTAIYEVLDRWHNFFKRQSKQRLSEEEQRGLFGELYYINEWININSSVPALIIKDWKGPLRNRIDFVQRTTGIEIKTISPRIRNEIKIANEKQLELNPVINRLLLYVLKVEKNESVGQSLQDLIIEIHSKLISTVPALATKFKDLLIEAGVVGEEYDDVLFFVHEELTYAVTEDFPKITSHQLANGVNNVSYSIDLSHCDKYRVQREDVFMTGR